MSALLICCSIGQGFASFSSDEEGQEGNAYQLLSGIENQNEGEIHIEIEKNDEKENQHDRANDIVLDREDSDDEEENGTLCCVGLAACTKNVVTYFGEWVVGSLKTLSSEEFCDVLLCCFYVNG